MAQKAHTTTAAKARRYEVSSGTAALIDCITATTDLYGQISDALRTCYGEATADNGKDAPYLEHIDALQALLFEEIKGRLTDAVIIEVENSHSSNPVI